MEYAAFLDELCLDKRVIAITRLKEPAPDAPQLREGCTLAAIRRVMAGATLIVTPVNATCKGGATGFGLRDGIPDVPGGFGNFLSCGGGEGCPPGERVKKTSELGEKMLLNQPQRVMEGFHAVELRPYQPHLCPDTVTVLVNPDQLSALIHLFNYEKSDYDTVIAPMVSGCASIFRIPFGELERGEAARAVIGNVDVFSRPHFDADSFFFTVPGTSFSHMLAIAGESVLVSPIWRGVKKRLG